MAKNKQDLGAAVDVTEEPDGKVKKDKKSKNVDEFGIEIPKKKRGLLKFLLIAIPVALCAGFVFGVIQWNLFNVRDHVIEAVIRLDPEHAESRRYYLTERVALEYEREEFEQDSLGRRAQLDELQAELSAWGTELDYERLRLEIWEERLELWQQRLTPIYRRDPQSAEFLEMYDLGRIYSFMAPEAAAVRLVALNTEEAAAILFFMDEGSAAAILAEIEPRTAAEITRNLLTN